jgi:glycerol-3-phosphate O-acyltransferase
VEKTMDRFTGRFLLPWLRFTVRPRDAAETIGEATAPVCYVVSRARKLDALVLQRACARAGLPRPRKQLRPAGVRSPLQSLLALSRKVGFWRSRLDRRAPADLVALLEALRGDPAFDVLLVPVEVYWGRAPGRERLPWYWLPFAEDWAVLGNMRRFVSVLFNGRGTVVEFGTGISLRALVGEQAPDRLAARRVARQLTARLTAMRTAYVGPDLSHKRTLMTAVLRARSVRTLVAQEVASRKLTRRQALAQAKQMFEEIAADYSHSFIQLAERVLKRLWTRIYDGVSVAHADTIAGIATGNELVYVPCHRSTMDDLLTPYAIYTQGYAIPHIAAGINLDLPIVGRMMRKAGAFFMRRSFRGSPLYSAVFTRYLGAIMARGHPVQYFIEGGRSRSGRSLTPKTGMLAMTLRSYLRQPVRPVMFVPVYIGYERVIEIESYVREMSGKPKEKETLRGFLRSLRRLRENFGQVHMNIGEPIALTPLLDEHLPDWRTRVGETSRGGMGATVDVLAQRIMRNIHAAAAVTPVNLLALAMLATPRQAMLAQDLQRQLATYLAILRAAPYSARMTVTQLPAAAIIQLGLARGLLVAGESDTLQLAPGQAEAMTWYRNNVLHLVALPSLLACCFVSTESRYEADLLRIVQRVHPYLQAELFLRWEEPELESALLAQLAGLSDAGLLASDGNQWRAAPADSGEAMQLSLLAQPMLQTIERYYLVIALLLRAGTGSIEQPDLAKRCQEMVGRMKTLYGFQSPEFFDRTLFDGFVGLLRRQGMVRADGEGRLVFGEELALIAEDLRLVLSEQLRHSFLQVLHD